MRFDRVTTLRELGDFHRARRATLEAIEAIREAGTPNGCGIMAKHDAVKNYDRHIAIRRAALYSA
jgi:hypothetical protein